jgi:GT2 family glycosyltransferase
MKAGSPRVVVIILNWNGKDDTLACLHSLGAVSYPNFEVVVVDNGSSDDSVAAIRDRFPNQAIVETGQNLGFAGGNNIGLQWARERGADYAFVLNNDTIVDPHVLSWLVESAESDPQIGIVGPKIFYHDDPGKIWSAGGVIERPWRPTMRGLDVLDDGQHDTACEVDWVSGCALMIRTDVVEQVGSIEPSYFMYYEEIDWCCRVREAGFKIVYVPEARLFHKIQPRRQELSPRYIYLMTRNRLLFVRDRGVAWPAIFALIVAENLRTVVAWTVWKRHQDKRPMRRPMLRGVSDFLAGRFGEPPGDL